MSCSDLCKCEGCKNCGEKHSPKDEKLQLPIDLDKLCAEVTISKLLDPLSPDVKQIPTADNSIINSNGEQGTNQSSEQCKQSAEAKQPVIDSKTSIFQ